jgi:uncharacterized membrane protein YjfL (UPF0719 family)
MTLLIIIIFISIILGLAWKDHTSFRQAQHVNYKNIIVSIGVLGTFIGIVIGLWNFDTHDIEASVPQLLNGLKFAFITSVVAMAVSIILSVIQAKPDETIKQNDDDDEIKQTLKAILDQVTQLNNYIHQKDYNRFTKLNANGEQLPKEATEWSAILDNDTELTWEIQENKQTYTNDNSSTYIEEINKQQLAAYNDWRLPTIEELETLNVDKTYFPYIQSSWYLSSTPNSEKTDQFYCFNFSNSRRGSSNNIQGYIILTRN